MRKFSPWFKTHCIFFVLYSLRVSITSWCMWTARRGQRSRWTVPNACSALQILTQDTAVTTACRNRTTCKLTTSTRPRETQEREREWVNEKERDWARVQLPNLCGTWTPTKKLREGRTKPPNQVVREETLIPNNNYNIHISHSKQIEKNISHVDNRKSHQEMEAAPM